MSWNCVTTAWPAAGPDLAATRSSCGRAIHCRHAASRRRCRRLAHVLHEGRLQVRHHARHEVVVLGRGQHARDVVVVLQRKQHAALGQLRRGEGFAQLKRGRQVVHAQRLRDAHLTQPLEPLQQVLVAGLQQLGGNVWRHLHVARVDVRHHGLKHLPGDVGDVDGGRLLLAVPAVEHGAERVRGREQRDAVRVELAPLHDERHVRQRGVVDVLGAQVHGLGGLRGQAVDGRGGVDLARQLQHRVGRLALHARLQRLVHQHVQQHLQPALVHKDGLDLRLGRQLGQRHGGALLHELVAAAQHEHHVGQHAPLQLLLHARDGLLHTVLGGLHRQLLAAVHQALERAHLDDVWDVVLVVRQPVESKGCIVLQVVVL
mmetsp:Transcript_28795/g.73393  ORF Transcript_28795/g.73393 Transcript_28795/m.73393 type:complete len:373 (-) Transcript_28795:1199-2317(-)